MRCSPRQLTYVVKLLILWTLISVSFGGVLDQNRVREIALEELRRTFGNRVQLESLKVYIKDPIHYLSIEERRLNLREGYPRGTMHLQLKTKKGIRRVSVSLELLWRCRLLVASEIIERGERVYPWQVKYEERYLKRCPNQGIESAEELIDYVALRGIKAGEPIRKNLLKREPMVRRGDEVDVIFRSGALEISFTGKALDTGFYGELIRVKSANTGKVLRGRVISEKAVLIK